MCRNLYQKTTTGLLLLAFACCMTLSSCNDFLDVESKHAAREDQQWETLEDTRAALMGVYGLTRAALAENNTHWICGDLRGGDFSVVNRPDLQAVVENNLNEPFVLLEEVSNWRRFYAAINAATLFIEKAPRTLDSDRSYSEENLSYDIAQARVLRAFAYFYMVRMWGDVPLITYSYDNGSFPEIEKTGAAVVLSYVKEELKAALNVLPYELGTNTNLYYGRNGTDWRGILLNKLSVYTLLAHIAAWEGNYADVETYTAFIMDNAANGYAEYVSVEDLTSSRGIFQTNSSRRGARLLSFTFRFSAGEATQSGHLEQLTLAAPLVQKSLPEIYIAKDRLFSVFNETDDKRFGINPVTGKYYTYFIHDAEALYPIFRKINVIQDGESDNGNYAVFGSALVFSRLEDVTLLRAEALCALNRPEDAVIHLNTIRKARNLAEISYRKDLDSDKVELIRAVFAERRRELMGEGWYWYDRIRQQKLVNDDPELGQLIDEGRIYWPANL